MMTTRLSPLLFTGLAVAALSLAACGGDDSTVVIGGSSLVIDNQSDFVIEEVFLTSVDSTDWGPNRLRGDVLFPGETLTLGVGCGFFDALLVDEEGVDCELHDLDLCLNDAVWVIRNNTCTVFGAAAKKRAEKAAAEAAATTDAK
jgi:hypothetical protein